MRRCRQNFLILDHDLHHITQRLPIFWQGGTKTEITQSRFLKNLAKGSGGAVAFLRSVDFGAFMMVCAIGPNRRKSAICASLSLFGDSYPTCSIEYPFEHIFIGWKASGHRILYK